MVSAFDVNADGHDEAVLCANQSSSNKGACNVFESPDQFVGFVFSQPRISAIGPSALSGMGQETIVAGDFSGDGGRDVAFPMPNIGRVDIHDGDRANLKLTNHLLVPESNRGFQHVIVLADANGDGKADLLIGAPNYDNGAALSSGAVFAFTGGVTMSTTPAWALYGNGADRLGAAIAVGKFRSAARSIAVSEPEYDGAGGASTNIGRVWIFDAPTSGYPAATSTAGAVQYFDGSDIDEKFGFSLANCGTLFNTAGDCLAIGAPTKSISSATGGRVFFKSSNGTVLSDAGTVSGLATGIAGVTCTSSFGEYIANAGNVANGLRDDFLVGAPDCDRPQQNEGRAFLYVSNSSGSFSASTWFKEGNEVGGRLGVVAGLGDVNGDHIDDFAVGMPLADNFSFTPTVVDAGRVFIFHGSTGTPSTSAAMSMSTSFPGNAGTSIAGGDINGDGYGDMIEGEPMFSDSSSTPTEGRIRVFFGGPTGMDSVPEYTVECETSSCFLGNAVAIGNVQNDRYMDAAWTRIDAGAVGVQLRTAAW
jgi:hypothetical protein